MPNKHFVAAPTERSAPLSFQVPGEVKALKSFRFIDMWNWLC